MHHTYPNQNLAVAWEDTCSWLKKDDIPFKNDAVLNILHIILAVMSSAAEAELGALFINSKTALSMRQMLTELGHPQPGTPMQTNNATAHPLLTIKIFPKALKAMEMQFQWLRCRNAQGQFCYYWRPDTQNWQITSPSITQPATTNLSAPQY
jgi:hypothetical protein